MHLPSVQYLIKKYDITKHTIIPTVARPWTARFPQGILRRETGERNFHGGSERRPG